VVKRVSLVKLRSDMPLAEAQRHWREQHSAQVSQALGGSGLRRYVVNLVDPEQTAAARHPLTPQVADPYNLNCDGFAETWYDDFESMQRLIAANPAATRGDEDQFIERVRVLVVHEHEII
jgi:hypothetical protein